jgi:hypothetical protein
MRSSRFGALCCGVLVAVTLAGSADGARTGKAGPGAIAATRGSTVVDNTAPTSKAGAGVPTATAGARTAAAPGSPPSWTVVNSGAVSNPAGRQTLGSVACPSGTVAWGGGVLGGSTGVLQNINGWYPIVSGGVATGWQGYMNNADSSDLSFFVYAVCAARPMHYSVQSLSLGNPNGSQTSGSVACPLNRKGKPFKAMGGGGYGVSSSVFQSINTSIPLTTGWRVDMNNASGADSSEVVYVICGARGGYRIVTGPEVANPPGAQTADVTVACPTGRVETGGGGFSSSGSTAVNMNSTVPDGSSEWRVDEDNNGAGDAFITAYAVCVK